MAPEPDCLLCGQPLRPDMTLSLGPLAACNRFEFPGHAAIETHPLSVAQCGGCDLVQLSSFPPVEFVRPRVPWIRYNEPVAHLDALAERLGGFFSTGEASAIGVGPFDGPLLERMGKRGISCVELDLAARVAAEQGRFPYLEAIQELLRPDILCAIAAEQGTADLVSCRYLIEHSHDPVAALQGLRHLVSENGVLLVEIPDSAKFLSNLDYSFIWEEHTCYFTEQTFRASAFRAGYEVMNFFRYPGALEDALVFMLRSRSPSIGRDVPAAAGEERDLFQRFRAGFENVRQRYIRAMDVIIACGRKAVIFGAGHQSIMFINALGLQRHVSFVIDDSPDKIGCLIPGTGIEIVSSEKLMEDLAIGVCLLGVAPAVESKLRSKYAGYLDRGGRMVSIFPAAGTGTLIDPER